MSAENTPNLEKYQNHVHRLIGTTGHLVNDFNNRVTGDLICDNRSLIKKAEDLCNLGTDIKRVLQAESRANLRRLSTLNIGKFKIAATTEPITVRYNNEIIMRILNVKESTAQFCSEDYPNLKDIQSQIRNPSVGFIFGNKEVDDGDVENDTSTILSIEMDSTTVATKDYPNKVFAETAELIGFLDKYCDDDLQFGYDKTLGVFYEYYSQFELQRNEASSFKNFWDILSYRENYRSLLDIGYSNVNLSYYTFSKKITAEITTLVTDIFNRVSNGEPIYHFWYNSHTYKNSLVSENGRIKVKEEIVKEMGSAFEELETLKTHIKRGALGVAKIGEQYVGWGNSVRITQLGKVESSLFNGRFVIFSIFY